MHSVDTPPARRDEPSGSLFASVFKHDFAASIVVFLVALPLCMGIAQASGVPVAAGLITGIVGGIVVGLLAGAPLQVSGPAAGLTVIVYGLVREHGLPALGVIVLLGGALQLAAGLLRLGQWFRAVSPAVIRGMLSGIGVLIFASQFHLMVDDKPKENGIANLVTIPEAIYKGIGVPELAPPESRGVRNDLLHEFGNLHEKQEEVRELVAERVGDAPTPEEAEIERALLGPLVARQEEVLARLREQAEVARTSVIAESGRPAGRRLLAAVDGAVAANERALEALRDRDLATVRQQQDAAYESLARVLSSLKNHNWAAIVGLLTIAVIVVWQTLIPKRVRVVPGALVAVVAATGLAFALDLPVLYVEVPDNLADGVHLPSWIAIKDLPFGAILTGALVIAAVASAETLLCATAVDQMHTGPRTRYDRELAAQGVGNMICGLLGGLPMTGVIVRSAANVQAGARSRFSAVFHGLWLLLFVAALGTALRLIPTACLAGLLVYTGWKLIDVKALRDLRRFGRSEVAIYLTTVVVIVAVDLLSGVIVGIALSGLKLLLAFSRLRARVNVAADGKRATLDLIGAATFIRLPKLAAALEQVPPGAVLQVDFNRLTYIDHACMDLLMSFSKQHLTTGGDVSFDWDSLHANVRRDAAAGHLREQFETLRPRSEPVTAGRENAA